MVRRTHHERTTAMQKLNHFCCSSMFGKTIVIVFREVNFHVLIILKTSK